MNPSIALTNFKIVDHSASFVNIDKAKVTVSENGNGCTLHIEGLVIKAEFKIVSDDPDDASSSIFKCARLNCTPRPDGSIDIDCVLTLNKGDGDGDSVSTSSSGSNQNTVSENAIPLPGPGSHDGPESGPDAVMPKTLVQILPDSPKITNKLPPVCDEKPVLAVNLIPESLRSIDSRPSITECVSENETYKAVIQELKHVIKATGVRRSDSVTSNGSGDAAKPDLEAALTTLRTIASSAANLDVLEPNTPNHRSMHTLKSDLIEQIDGFLEKLARPEHPLPNPARAVCEKVLPIIKMRLEAQLEESRAPNGTPRRPSYGSSGPASPNVTGMLCDVLDQGGEVSGSSTSLDRIKRQSLHRNLSSSPVMSDVGREKLLKANFERNYARHTTNVVAIRKFMLQKRFLTDVPLLASKDNKYSEFQDAFTEMDDFVTIWERASPAQIAELGTDLSLKLGDNIASLKSEMNEFREYVAQTILHRKYGASATVAQQSVKAMQKVPKLQKVPGMQTPISAK